MSQETDNRVEQLQAVLSNHDQLKRELSEKQESLNRATYQLETTEIRLRIVEEEMQALESLTLTSIFSSIAGTKIGKLDNLRDQIRALDQQYQVQSHNVETIRQQVERLRAEIDAMAGAQEELRTLCPDAAFPARSVGTATRSQESQASPDRTGQLEWVIEAGESLLTHLNGMYTLCNNLRRNKGISGRGPALLAGAMQGCRNRSANAVTGQLAEAVQHFCRQVAELQLNPADRAEAEILSSLSQVERFVDAGAGLLGTQSETWAELEVLIRSLVSDLQDAHTHRGGSRS